MRAIVANQTIQPLPTQHQPLIQTLLLDTPNKRSQIALALGTRTNVPITSTCQRYSREALRISCHFLELESVVFHRRVSLYLRILRF
jgi:hypothetical protein